DVPFFFHTPMAIGRGRGEQITPLPLAQTLHLVLVCPKEGVSTAEVYGRLSLPSERRPVQPLFESLATGDASTFGPLLFNRLETTACQLCPAIGAAQDALRAARLAGARMTGSGSGAFGLAPSRDVAAQAARTIRERFPGRVFLVRSTR